jgi:hypothetical protein
LGFSHLTKIIGLIFIGVVYSLTGCVSVGTDFRKQGFIMFQKDFMAAEGAPGLHEVIELKNVKVHIVGGHELNHLLNFKNHKIANPDKLDESGGNRDDTVDNMVRRTRSGRLNHRE